MPNKETPQGKPEREIETYSAHIAGFLKKVQPGQRFGFFDMDQTLTPRGVDVEKMAYTEYGLIPSERLAEWLSFKEVTGSILPERLVSEMYSARTVTPELAMHTGFAEGLLMNREVVRALGRSIGHRIRAEKLFREEAIEVLKECEQRGIQPVVVTSSPLELAYGVIQTVFQPTIPATPITVFGTEYTYDSWGRAGQSLYMSGENKYSLVRACIAKGAQAVFGIGDKPESSDMFINLCTIQVPVNNTDDTEGKSGWTRLLGELRGEHKTVDSQERAR